MSEILSSRKIEHFTFNILDSLQAPVITYDQMWASAIPPRVMKIIPEARMIAAMKKESLATIPEVSAYIMTRSFIGPMDNDWTDIFCHASCSMCETWFKEDRWDDVEASRKLNRYQDDLMWKLRMWIYEKRRFYLGKKLKAQEKPIRFATHKYDRL